MILRLFQCAMPQYDTRNLFSTSSIGEFTRNTHQLQHHMRLRPLQHLRRFMNTSLSLHQDSKSKSKAGNRKPSGSILELANLILWLYILWRLESIERRLEDLERG